MSTCRRNKTQKECDRLVVENGRHIEPECRGVADGLGGVGECDSSIFDVITDGDTASNGQRGVSDVAGSRAV